MRLARLAVTALIASTTLVATAPMSPAAAAPASDLFISEYVEGSSFNKAIEIYNGTGATVDLAGYVVSVYFNGAATASANISLTGTVADGDVFVLSDDGADPAMLAVTDQQTTSSLWNGDDAIVLTHDGAPVDSIGQVGVDPGTEWGLGLISTADNTIRRLPTVCTGDINPTDVFDPAVEWEGFANNTFDGLGSHTATCGGPVSPVINEFSASTAGPDVEYVEIKAAPDTDLSNLTVLEIEGDFSGTNTGTIDEVIPLVTTDVSGYYLASLPANALENGTLTLLLVDGFTGVFNDDLDTNDDGVFDVTPWASIIDGVSVADGGSSDLTYDATVLGPNYDGLSSFAPGGASRIPDGVDTDTTADWARNDFDLYGIPGFAGTPAIGEAVNTPGATNEVITVLPPRPLAIHDVQGSGSSSPEAGNGVIVDGIVTADFQGAGQLNGFHVQEPDSDVDANPNTSEGIFVFSTLVDVNVGDFVTVTGVATEFNGLTEVGSVTSIVVESSGNPLPAATAISLPSTEAERETVEGMLVTFPQDLTISEFFNFDRFGEIVLSDGRQFQPTAVFDPGSPEATALATANALGRITLDDGRSSQNPDPAIHPNGDVFDLTNLFRGGDTVANVTGIMDYAFGLYRIQPTQGADYTAVNARGPVPDVGGNLQVASFNVLNYFTTFGSRGAANQVEFDRQRDKIIAAITELDADVVGLLEIENNDAAIIDLVDGLNTVAGSTKYAYIDTGVVGTDEIKVAIIYQPAAATPLGSYAVLDSSVDPRFLDDKNRPAIAQTFMSNSGGAAVTVVVNHLKSKGSACDDVGDPDLFDGAGNCNITRTLAAEALVDWTAADPTGFDAPSLIIGDLNSYDQEDPIDALIAGGYTDLVAQFGGEFAYSYVFDGQLGYLDHALADADLLPNVTGTEVWHINADEADLIDYLTRFKRDAQDAIYAPDPFRSSDHDPVLIGLDLCETEAPQLNIGLSLTSLTPPNHKLVPITATVSATDNFDQHPVVELVSVVSDEPDNGLGDGDTTGDIVIIDDTHFQLRAERSGTGDGRTYTITYSATDSCGNTTIGQATVEVPRNASGNGGGKKPK
jgi:predicted extracellular nuclease